MDREKIIVIDFGGQYNQLVARRVRECNVYCEIYSYKKVYPTLIGEEEMACNDVFPPIIPNWDHTARCGYNGYLFHQSTPELFEKHAQDVLGKIQGKDETTNLCFLKSWNEWGEGNYMEPDMRYQRGYLLALKKAIDSIKKK